MCISTGNNDSIFFLGVTPPLNLFASKYYCNSLSFQLLSNHTTEFYETFLDNKDIHVLWRCAYRQEVTINYFCELHPFEFICFNILLQQFVIATPLKPFWDNKDILCRCAYWQEITIQFFSTSYAPLNLFASIYFCNSLSSQLLWNHTTEFHETLKIIRT